MGLFSRERQEKFFLNQREVIIIDRIYPGKDIKTINFIEGIKQEIVLYCSSALDAKLFPSITFILEETKKEVAWINTPEIIGGKAVIYLSPLFMLEKSNGRTNLIRPNLSSTIQHELNHIWDEQETGMLSLYSQVEQKTNKLLAESPISTDFSNVRKDLLNFFWKLRLEGLPTYLKHRKTLFFTKEAFEQSYGQAEIEVKVVHNRWASFLVYAHDQRNSKNSASLLAKKMRDCYYTVAPHLLYTIIFAEKGNLTFKEIIRMRTFAFIKLYESCARKLGYSPLVSATSGDGILDYKRMVVEWWVVAKPK